MTTTASPPSATPSAPKLARQTPVWAKILLVVLVLLLLAATAFAGLTVGKFLGAAESRDTQVIRSITREEQVILVTAGVTDVIEERGDGLDVFGLFTVPGSERAMLLRYEYDAKFGVEGGDVSITRTGDNAYLVSIPAFAFLGYENPDVSIAKEENGILSWTTPEIDKFEVIEQVLTAEAVDSHLDGFRPVLEEQARVFYSGIITAIDPAITLEFEFAG
ncbi:hypothetical protein [Naasia sp. SYSU D00948]|uniref:hypothetical protein n=1 Tax=Naasia sp. SYSU D00948 TaxID=2817379 RepID=UPI001B301934|nr:hypothetical protein [Naasia sp. SYSU D00948]